MASTTEYEDERVNLSKDAPKQARPRKKILVPPKPHEKRYSSFNKPQITLDTETTGLDPDKGDRILEIGCVRLNGREISLDPDDYLQIYINPERDIPEETTAIHGITNEKVKDCPVFADIVDEFLDFVSDTELLIHNAKFDVGFINMELERLGRGRLEDYVAQITDTLEIAREMYPGRRVSLDGLCLMHKIDNSARVFHGALLDSQLLAEVYLTMTRGQGEIDLDNWGDAVEIPPEIIARLTMPEPSPEELAEHEKMLDKADKQCKATCAWRKALGIGVEAVFFPAEAVNRLDDPVLCLVPFLPADEGELLCRESDRRTFQAGGLYAQPDAVIALRAGGVLAVEYKSRGGRMDDPHDIPGSLRPKDLLQTVIGAMVLSASEGVACAPVLRTNNAVYFLRPGKTLATLLAERIGAAVSFVKPYAERSGISASDYAELCVVPAQMLSGRPARSEGGLRGEAAHARMLR